MTEIDLGSTNEEPLPDDEPHGRLFTESQRRVLRFLCQGLTNNEIADRIGLKEATIKGTVSGILKKLRVHSRTQAVVRVCQDGMVSPDWCEGTEFGAPDLRSMQEAGDVPESAVRRVDALTEREMEVLDMVSRGMANKEVAFRLGVREGTVKAHMGNILRKLGVSSRMKLVIEVSKLHTAASRSRPETPVGDRKQA
jgi:DNA-binding NarL/FixJ family response regulator